MEDLDLLLLDGEDEGMVSAAMAFIDAVGGGEAKSSSASSDESVSSAASKLETKKPTRRKRKTQPGYSTEHGRRKKAEVLALRAEVHGLEEWVTHLTRGKPEFQKLQQSENVNEKLKAILASQTKFGKSILAAIQQTSAFADKEFVFNVPRPIPQSLENAAVIAQLRDGARFLYLDQSSVVPQPSSDAYSCVMVPKIHPSRGKMFESSTVCSALCSMKVASDILWLEYTTPGNYKDKSYRFMEPAGPNSVKKNFDLLLRSKGGGLMPMNSLMFASKLDESNRIVMVRDYVAFLPTAGIRMRCHHWTIVTPSDSTHSCRIHFFTQLFLEGDEGLSASPEDIDYIQQVALETWSTKMHIKDISDAMEDMEEVYFRLHAQFIRLCQRLLSAKNPELSFVYAPQKSLLALLEHADALQTDVKLDTLYLPRKSQCFELRWFNALPLWTLIRDRVIGYDTILVNQLLKHYGARGFFYREDSRVVVDMSYGVFNPATAAQSWLRLVALKFKILHTILFLFFVITALVAFVLMETQKRMITFAALFQNRMQLQIPLANLVVTFFAQSLMFVPVLVGMLFFLFELYKDRLLAFGIMTVMWVGESFSVISVRCRLSQAYFPPLFFCLFTFFHVYLFSFPFGFSYVALGATSLLLLQLMLFFWNCFEIPALNRGEISRVCPREPLFLSFSF
uniref:Uncharacterized protein n=1 Tax=Phytophthora ramorum TaxID=164328 RepID=H3HDY2_PHYRM